MSDRSFRFSHAITRKPSASIVRGLRAIDVGAPDLAVFEQHHAAYVAALRDSGAEVTVLDPLEIFPDAVFVEDTALCLQEGAILMRPGAPTRMGEVAEMVPHLRALYGEVREICGDESAIEGGDILTTETEILVGRSSRTNAAGIQELHALTTGWGYKLREVITPAGILHFKSECALLDGETILATRRLAATGCFASYKVIHTAEGEEAAANAVRMNDLLLMPEGFPQTRERLDNAGYDLREIGNSEAAKLDGGLSCLSLRFSPKR